MAIILAPKAMAGIEEPPSWSCSPGNTCPNSLPLRCWIPIYSGALKEPPMNVPVSVSQSLFSQCCCNATSIPPSPLLPGLQLRRCLILLAAAKLRAWAGSHTLTLGYSPRLQGMGRWERSGNYLCKYVTISDIQITKEKVELFRNVH